MAGLNGEIVIRMDYRPCTVGGREALFHCWSIRAFPFTALMVGQTSGQMTMPVGIVEFQNGRIGEVSPEEITFSDNMHRNYFFGSTEAEAQT